MLVCAGDSITHALVSADYVSLLEHDLAPSGVEVVNAGFSGDLAWNLLQRLGDVVACRPDVVTVLIGTNDVAAHIDDSWRDNYLKAQRLPQHPTLDWYADNLRAIVDRLHTETSARVVLIEIPPLGEDLTSADNDRVRSYNEIVRSVGAETGVTVLALFDHLAAALAEHPGSTPFDGTKKAMVRAAYRRVLRRASYDEIADREGLHVLSDHVHLAERGARVVADLVGAALVPEGEEIAVRDVIVEASGRPARWYVPEAGADAALLWLHGGGFSGGSIDMAEGDAVARAVARGGVAVLNADYRLVAPWSRARRWRGAPAARFPAPLEDTTAAWHELQAEADRLGIPPDRRFVGGASAGGNLAAMTALEAGPAADGVVLLYPLLHPDLETAKPHTRFFMRWMGQNLVGHGVRAADGFPSHERLAGFPRTTVIAAEKDPLRPSAEAFVEDLRSHGVPVDLHVEVGAGHGFANRPLHPSFGSTVQSIRAFVRGGR